MSQLPTYKTSKVFDAALPDPTPLGVLREMLAEVEHFPDTALADIKTAYDDKQQPYIDVTITTEDTP